MSNQKIAVVTDSSAHIPNTMQTGLDITVIPLWLIWEDQNLRDGIDIQPEEFYRRLRHASKLPTTAQPTVKEFVDLFKQLERQSDAIVAVLASSRISGTVASAEKAKEELPGIPIRVVDSLSSSMGQGLIVLAAARAAAEGRALDEVVHAAESMRKNSHLLFVVDTLEYLHKGGRISGGKRLLGTALQIKPLLQFKDGQIVPLAQARTKRKAIELLLEIVEERLAGGRMVEAAIVDVENPEDGEAVKAMIEDRFQPESVFRSGVSPVVGTHVGPGALGIAFYGD
ncbi:MAG TPA: DegV family protein [Anaerolineae bacterium]|nr:DegV family protein [Anaerolineae bacterium]